MATITKSKNLYTPMGRMSDLKTTPISVAMFKKTLCDESKKFKLSVLLFFTNELGELIQFSGDIYFSSLKSYYKLTDTYAEIEGIHGLTIRGSDEEYNLYSSLQLEYFLEIRKRHDTKCAKLSLLLLSHGVSGEMDDYDSAPQYVKRYYYGEDESDEKIGMNVARCNKKVVKDESEYIELGKTERELMINLDGHLFYKDY